MNDWWWENTGTPITGSKPEAKVVEKPDVFISYQWGKQKEVIYHII